MATTVKYDGVEIYPTPFVSKTVEAVDYGDRWGSAQNITLRGEMTGIGTGRINNVTDLFQQGFKTLTVESNGDTSYYVANNCVLQSLSFGQNKFVAGSDVPVPYTVTLKAYDVPSGVTNISNKYTYRENRDGTVAVTREIAAKGLKTSSSDPIDNAYNFVALFTGKDPNTAAAPLLVSGATQSVLRSVSESVNRLDASYSVTENWVYETGSSNAYTKVASLNVEEDRSQEYITVTLDLNFNGDIRNPFSTLQNAVRDFDVYSEVNNYGLATGEMFVNDFSINENEDSNSITYNMNFLSGESLQALSGIMVHNISMNWDEIKNEKSYSINSEFKVKGPKDHKAKRIETEKYEIIQNYGHYIAYLYHAIKDSEVYNQFETVLGDGHELNPNPRDFKIQEDLTKSSLSFSASFDDSDFKIKQTNTLPNGKSYPVSIGTTNYNVSVTPENWIFQMDPAANIEGHFVIQDLQCKSRERFSLSINNDDIGNGLGDGTDISRFESFTGVSGLADHIINVVSGYNTSNRFYLSNSSVNSGDLNANIRKEYILKTGLAPEFSKNKFNGFLGAGYGRRIAGYKFGY